MKSDAVSPTDAPHLQRGGIDGAPFMQPRRLQDVGELSRSAQGTVSALSSATRATASLSSRHHLTSGSENRCDRIADERDLLVAIHGDEQTALAIPVGQRCCLTMIGLKASEDGVLIVIRTALHIRTTT